MYIHKEGRGLLWKLGLVEALLLGLVTWLAPHWTIAHYALLVIMVSLWGFFLYFFRIPNRKTLYDDKVLITPADGTVCAVEEVEENEYLKCRCLQVSVFMYGTDVHVNRYPCNGTVEYVNYQKGNYFVASLPKSAEINERCSVGILTDSGERILVRQIAGLMARRIVCYSKVGDRAKQNDEFGFIKFGSRVDLFLPLGTKVLPEMKKQIYGCLDPLAVLPSAQ